MKSIEELLAAQNIIPERPPSLDPSGRRLDIFPAEVSGYYRKLRNIVYWSLLVLFLVVPWTTYKGQQTILLDLGAKQFTFFGLTFLAHDGPIIFFIFGLIVFGLLLATALYGRVWCGWACPQTVFIDGLFRRVEILIEGSHIKRKKLAAAPMTIPKFTKKSVKWLLYVVISSHTAHSIVAYFVGAKNLFWITTGDPSENLTLFLFIQIFTVLIAINFGWFREQFCLVACPYGRIQSVLMDNISKTVIYDYKRGEPRRQPGQKDYADCVNCFKCVSVCPTGIDIRNGQQVECIACTACIDACDDVMMKVHKPKGLIRYASEEEIDGGATHKKTFNFRAALYGLGLALCLAGLFYFVLARDSLSVQIHRATDSPYQVTPMNDGDLILNHFRIHLTNQSSSAIRVESFVIDDRGVEVVTPMLPLDLDAYQRKSAHIFLKVPASRLLSSRLAVRWRLNFKNQSKILQTKSGRLTILGPDSRKKE